MNLRMLMAAIASVATIDLAFAQVFTLPVTSTWQISTDNGTTWNSGLTTVPQGTSNVRVRMEVSWTPPTTTPSAYLVSAVFDGYVRGVDGAGSMDTVADINMLFDGALQPAPAELNIAGRRVSSDLIKIDPGANLPLGQGANVIVGNSPVTGSVTLGTPITVFDYRLQLDGSTGSRELGLVYAPVLFPVRVSTALPAGFTSLTWQPLSQPATLVVVPSPAGLAVAGVVGAVLLRRRRGNNE